MVLAAQLNDIVLYDTPEEYRDAFLSTVKGFARRRKTPFTAEDVTAKVGLPPHSTSAIGPLMGFAVREYGLTRVDEVPATRPNQKGSKIGAYLGA